MRNAEIAAHFDELGDLYELDRAVVYRVVAYRNAAKAIREAPVSVEELAREGKATSLSGVGKTIAEKIDAVLETGQIPSAVKVKAKYPPGLVEITRIPGLGPKKARKLFDTLAVDSLDSLKAAIEQEKVRDVPGFGVKTEETIAHALASGETAPSPRILHSQAARIADSLVSVLREHPACQQVEVAGSLRRWADTCKDIDIVATALDARALVDAFAELPLLGEVHRAGEAGARGITHNGVAVDFRIVAPENWGNLLQHLAGSGKHNEAMRTDAVKRGFHVSEYGVIDDSTETTHSCATEEEVYALVGMQHIPPELRENRGELEAARPGGAPGGGGGGGAAGAAGAGRTGRRARRAALPHGGLRWAADDRADGRGCARARLRLHRDHRPLGDARLRQRRAGGCAEGDHRAHRGAERSRRLRPCADPRRVRDQHRSGRFA